MFNGNIISVDTPDNHSVFMDLFRNELETMLNTLLLAELTEFLSYEKYNVSGYNTVNSHNKYYERSLHTIFGNITIKMPNVRLGQFQNKLLIPLNDKQYIYFCNLLSSNLFSSFLISACAISIRTIGR